METTDVLHFGHFDSRGGSTVVKATEVKDVERAFNCYRMAFWGVPVAEQNEEEQGISFHNALLDYEGMKQVFSKQPLEPGEQDAFYGGEFYVFHPTWEHDGKTHTDENIILLIPQGDMEEPEDEDVKYPLPEWVDLQGWRRDGMVMATLGEDAYGLIYTDPEKEE